MAATYDILDAAKIIETLSDSEAGILLKALCRIKAGETLSEVPRAVRVVLSMEMDRFTAAMEHRQKVSEKRRSAVSKRWENKAVQTDTNVPKSIQTHTNEYNCIDLYNSPPLSTPIINNPPYTNTNVLVTTPKGVASKKFIPPKVEEVREFAREHGLNVDPEAFVDHYTSNGWKVGGRSAMKDWKAACRNWSRNQSNFVGSKSVKQPVQERMKI